MIRIIFDEPSRKYIKNKNLTKRNREFHRDKIFSIMSKQSEKCSNLKSTFDAVLNNNVGKNIYTKINHIFFTDEEVRHCTTYLKFL